MSSRRRRDLTSAHCQLGATAARTPTGATRIGNGAILTFDHGPRGSRGNLAIIERLHSLGLSDCLRTYKGALTPTFRTTRGGLHHQMDHLYVTPPLLNALTHYAVGSTARVFHPKSSLSDHLPIVADITMPN